MNKQTQIIVGLGIALILLIGFIGSNYWSNYRNEINFEIFQEGQMNAIYTILDKVITEGYVQITSGNESIILVQYRE